MATLINSTIRLREVFTSRLLPSKKLVGSAMGFLLSEEGSPLLVRIQCEGDICKELEGLPEQTRIFIEQGELFNTSWDRDGGGKGYMPVVRPDRLRVRTTQLEQVNGSA